MPKPWQKLFQQGNLFPCPHYSDPGLNWWTTSSHPPWMSDPHHCSIAHQIWAENQQGSVPPLGWVCSEPSRSHSAKPISVCALSTLTHHKDFPGFCSLLVFFWFWLCLFLILTSLDLSSYLVFAYCLIPCLVLNLFLPIIVDWLLNFKPHLRSHSSPSPDEFSFLYFLLKGIGGSFQEVN